MTPGFPDDCFQSLIDPWWKTTQDREIRRGHLVWAFVPYVSQIPYELVPEGRGNATNHSIANYRVEPMDLTRTTTAAALPVAGLPLNPGERYGAYRGKVRPVLVLSEGGSEVPKEHKSRGASWQTALTLLVAPYYGVEGGASRGGFKQSFVDRIRRCEYPQYFWDRLPLGAGESILRLDHLQPIGRDASSYEWTPFHLSDDALKTMNEWMTWLLTGKLTKDGVIEAFRKDFMELAGSG